MSDDDLRAKLRPFLETYAAGREAELETFMAMLFYHQGQYGSNDDFAALNDKITVSPPPPKKKNTHTHTKKKTLPRAHRARSQTIYPAFSHAHERERTHTKVQTPPC